MDESEEQFFSSQTAACVWTLKEKVAHRLIRERLEDVYNDIKKRETDYAIPHHGLLKAIACATLAQGLSLETAEKTFNLDLDQQAWHRLFPEQAGKITVIPPRRPWRIGVVFIQKVRNDCFGINPEPFNTLVRTAFLDPSRGFLKILTRKDSLVKELAEIVADMPIPVQPEDRYAHLMAFAHGSLYAHSHFLAIALRGILNG